MEFNKKIGYMVLVGVVGIAVISGSVAYSAGRNVQKHINADNESVAVLAEKTANADAEYQLCWLRWVRMNRS